MEELKQNAVTENETPEEKVRLIKKETADFKKLLGILAVAVICTLIGYEMMTILVSGVLSFLLRIYYERTDLYSIDGFIASLNESGVLVFTRDFEYLIMWLISDIIVYTPPLVIFWLVFRKYHKPDKTEPPHANSYASPAVSKSAAYDFKYHWVLLFFVAGYTLSTVASILSQYIAEIMSVIFGTGGLKNVFESVMPQNITQTAIMFFVVGVIAPVCEECVYRHLLLKPLRRYGDLQAVLITAVLFGFFHGNLTQFLYTTAAGVVLGIIAVKANSVVPAILVHALNNSYDLISTSVYSLAAEEKIPISPDSVNSFILLFLAVGAVAFLYMMSKGYFKLDNSNPHISGKERAKMIARNPLILIMTVVLIVVTVRGS